VFTRALHWSLSWAISIQSTPSHPISLRSILMFKTTVMFIVISHCQKQLDLQDFLTSVTALNYPSRTSFQGVTLLLMVMLCWIRPCTFLFGYPSQVFLNASQMLTSVWIFSSISGWFTKLVHWLQLYWRCWTCVFLYIPSVL
jgi:hypothetical protein